MKLQKTICAKFLIGSLLTVFFLTLPVICIAQNKIAFTSTRDSANGEIYVMNPDGTNQTRLTSSGYSTDPSFTADGSKIAFTSSQNGFRGISVMNADGSNKTLLTNNTSGDIEPAFSPDGSKIAFVSGRDNVGYEIYIMNADGTNQRRLTDNLYRYDGQQKFSPDGSKIVFTSYRDLNNEIYVMNADGTNQIRLTNNQSQESYPSFSPDGSKITFVSFRDGNGEIYVMNADGTNQIRLTNNQAFDFQPVFSPDGSKIAFASGRSGNVEIYVMNADGTNLINLTNNPANDTQPSWGGKAARRPVLIIPGIAGTYAADITNDNLWLLNRGVQPSALQIDPLARVYHDLIKTFENVGYVKNKDLFVVNYDWRLIPGPIDGSIDGTVNGITAQSISDNTFQYGVDYLGLALRQAAERWKQDHPGEKLEEVDIVAHSTGGLVARTYIQSPAYNEVFGGSDKLPRVKNLIMVGVPNRGASKAWNALHDNWIVDPVYQLILSKIVNRAYQKVLAGQTILGSPAPITLNSIRDAQGNPDRIKFINQYVPTIRALLATYNFADFGSGFTNVNSNILERNTWALDLNNGLDLFPTADPSPFASKSKVTVIYGTSGSTATSVKQMTGSAGRRVIAPFTDFISRDAQSGEIWYDDIVAPSSGDGTVPIDSSTGQFIGDSRVTLKSFATGVNTQGDASHTGLMANADVQKTILQTVGASFQDSNISTGLGQPQSVIASIILDPVDGFLVDGAGRRLGYSESTGGLSEIPNSIWFGNENGIGWIFGSVQQPLRLELTGRGESYYVMVSVQTNNGESGGLVNSGFLASGAQRSLPVIIGNDLQYKCPLGKGYWKNNPNAWTVNSLTLGNQTYTKAELLTILNTSVGSGRNADASLIIAHQLIAAKLNVANGSDPAPVSSAIGDADNLLAPYAGKLPYRIKPSSASGQAMVSATSRMDSYNNGLLTPTCNP
jgi:dipeptidyl aminopeptidase/acylaminoacyl peptidase